MGTTKLLAEVMVALIKDGLLGPHALLSAVALVSDTEFWLVALGRSEVLSGPPQVMHYDHKRPWRERIRDLAAGDIPSGLTWEPYNGMGTTEWEPEDR